MIPTIIFSSRNKLDVPLFILFEDTVYTCIVRVCYKKHFDASMIPIIIFSSRNKLDVPLFILFEDTMYTCIVRVCYVAFYITHTWCETSEKPNRFPIICLDQQLDPGKGIGYEVQRARPRDCKKSLYSHLTSHLSIELHSGGCKRTYIKDRQGISAPD